MNEKIRDVFRNRRLPAGELDASAFIPLADVGHQLLWVNHLDEIGNRVFVNVKLQSSVSVIRVHSFKQLCTVSKIVDVEFYNSVPNWIVVYF